MKSWLSILFFLFAVPLFGAESFDSLVGPVTVKEVSTAKSTLVPYITWGGDCAAFYANGTSLLTTADSIYGKLGLSFKFVNGDDFIQKAKLRIFVVRSE